MTSGSQTIALGALALRCRLGGAGTLGARTASATPVSASGEPERDEAGDAGARRPRPGARRSSPNSSIRTRPARSVPTTAPIVLAKYRRPNAWLSADDRAKWRTRAGNVAPIMIVAGRQGEDREDEARQGEERRALERRVDAAIGVVDERERDGRDEHDDDEHDLQQRRTAAAGSAPGRRSAHRPWHRSPCRRRSR